MDRFVKLKNKTLDIEGNSPLDKFVSDVFRFLISAKTFPVFLDRTAKVWDLKTGEEIMSLASHKRDVAAVKFSPNMNVVFTVYQSTVKVNLLF